MRPFPAAPALRTWRSATSQSRPRIPAISRPRPSAAFRSPIPRWTEPAASPSPPGYRAGKPRHARAPSLPATDGTSSKSDTTDTDWQRKQTTDTSLPQRTDGSLALPPATADCPAAPAVHSQPAQAAHSPDNNASKQSTLAGHATTSQQPQHRLKHIKHTATRILAA